MFSVFRRWFRRALLIGMGISMSFNLSNTRVIRLESENNNLKDNTKNRPQEQKNNNTEDLSSKKFTLGVYIEEYDKENIKGLKIIDVIRDLLADKAGLKKGDIITEIDDKKVKSLYDYKKLIPKNEINSRKFTILRAGKIMKIIVSK